MSTALSSFDYISVSSAEVFTAGSTDNTTRCVDITIIDNNVLEGDKTFTVALTTADPDVMLLSAGETVVTITDNDGKGTG